jgi:HK97 family phage prohead protease
MDKIIKEFCVTIETKESSADEKELYCGSFKAIASTYGNVDHVDDVIMEGAFKQLIEDIKSCGKLPKGLIQHSHKDIGYKMTDIYEQGSMIVVEGKFLNTSKGRDLRVEVKSGAMDKMSIGFSIGDHKFRDDGIREINTIKKLYEVSFVTFPANEQASVLESKSKPKTIREFESALKDLGYSNAESKTIAIGGFKALDHREDDQEHREDELSPGLKELFQNIQEALTNGN